MLRRFLKRRSGYLISVEDAVRLAALRVKLRQKAETRGGQEPAPFLNDVLGIPLPPIGYYSKQLEMMEAVRDHRRVAVLGANGTGKDWVAGRLVLWWLQYHKPAKVLILGPTHKQVSEIVWKETRMGYYTSKTPLGGQMLETPKWTLSDEAFVLGFATDQPYNIQGFHSPHLLIILTQAHQLTPDEFQAVKTLNPERLVMTGNPLTLAGEFYEAFHSKADLWHTIRISAFESPNVQEGKEIIPGLVSLRDVEERKAEYGEDSAFYQASVLGVFPESLEDCLIQRPWVDKAINSIMSHNGPPLLACDVGRGGDKSVLMRRDGKAELLWRGVTPDIMLVVGKIKEYLDIHPECENRVVIDDTGVGGGVTDRLKELGVKAIPFIAGEKAKDDRRFANATAEAWGLMADAFRSGEISIPNDPALITQLITRQYKIQSDRRIILESKADLRAKGGRSPDEADALAMTFSPAATRRMRVWV